MIMFDKFREACKSLSRKVRKSDLAPIESLPETPRIDMGSMWTKHSTGDVYIVRDYDYERKEYIITDDATGGFWRVREEVLLKSFICVLVPVEKEPEEFEF